MPRDGAASTLRPRLALAGVDDEHRATRVVRDPFADTPDRAQAVESTWAYDDEVGLARALDERTGGIAGVPAVDPLGPRPFGPRRRAVCRGYDEER